MRNGPMTHSIPVGSFSGASYEMPTHYPKELLTLSFDEQNKRIMDLIETQIQKSEEVLKLTSNSTNTLINDVVSLFPNLKDVNWLSRENKLFQRASYRDILNLGTKMAATKDGDNESNNSEKATSEESSDDSTIKAVKSLENCLVDNYCSVKVYGERSFEDYSHSKASKSKEVPNKSLPNRNRKESLNGGVESVEKLNCKNSPSDSEIQGKKLTLKVPSVKSTLKRNSPVRQKARNLPSARSRNGKSFQLKTQPKSFVTNNSGKFSQEICLKQSQKSSDLQSLIGTGDDNLKQYHPHFQERKQTHFPLSSVKILYSSIKQNEQTCSNPLSNTSTCVSSPEENNMAFSCSDDVVIEELSDTGSQKVPNEKKMHSNSLLKSQGNGPNHIALNNNQIYEKKQHKPLIPLLTKRASMAQKNKLSAGQNEKLSQRTSKVKSNSFDRNGHVPFVEKNMSVPKQNESLIASCERYSGVRCNSDSFSSSLDSLLPEKLDDCFGKDSFLSDSNDPTSTDSTVENKTNEGKNDIDLKINQNTIFTKPNELCELKKCGLSLPALPEKKSTPTSISKTFLPKYERKKLNALKPPPHLPPLEKCKVLAKNILIDFPLGQDNVTLIEETQLGEHKTPTLPALI